LLEILQLSKYNISNAYLARGLINMGYITIKEVAEECGVSSRAGDFHITNKRTVMLALLCLIILLILSGCAISTADSTQNVVFCNNDAHSNYPGVVSESLQAFEVRTTNNRAFEYLEKGYVAEVFDPQAISALRAGNATYWYPHYQATVVIAVDRERTDANIKTWSDLSHTDELVGISSAIQSNPRVNNPLMMAAIAFGLEGEGFTLNKVTDFLAAIQSEGRLVRNSLEPPIVICYDFQAADLIKSGHNIEIIIPSEGTFTYIKGLLSSTELTFSGDVDNLLLANGFRLLDGRSYDTLYPDAAAYENASVITDYEHLITASQNATRTLRKDVLRTRLYSSKDDRQHQWWVLVYIIIVLVWLASFMNRIANKNMRRTILLAGILLMGWMLARLLSYQLDISTVFRLYINYTYYLFQLSLPVVLLWLAHIIGKYEGIIPMPWWIKTFAVYMFSLIVFVYTNNLHHGLYIFDFTNPNWGDEYGHGFAYTLIHASWQISFVATMLLLFLKCKGNVRKTGFLFLLTFVIVLFAYQYGYQNYIPIARDSDTTMVKGILILFFIELLIRAGLIPVNTKYKKLFANSPLGMRINDITGKAVWASASVVDYDKATLENALSSHPLPTQQDDTTLLFASPIAGGHML
jgi:hypothetical protein